MSQWIEDKADEISKRTVDFYVTFSDDEYYALPVLEGATVLLSKDRRSNRFLSNIEIDIVSSLMRDKQSLYHDLKARLIVKMVRLDSNLGDTSDISEYSALGEEVFERWANEILEELKQDRE